MKHDAPVVAARTAALPLHRPPSSAAAFEPPTAEAAVWSTGSSSGKGGVLRVSASATPSSPTQKRPPERQPLAELQRSRPRVSTERRLVVVAIRALRTADTQLPQLSGSRGWSVPRVSRRTQGRGGWGVCSG